MKKVVKSSEAIKSADDYSVARPNTNEVLDYIEELAGPDTCKSMLLSLLNYLSDRQVGDWARSEGWID